MTDRPPYDMADAALRHADLILRASGSGLRNYTMDRTRKAILSATLDCIEEAYRAGAAFAQERLTKQVPHD